jgi:AcrR family transcriptional regulator
VPKPPIYILEIIYHTYGMETTSRRELHSADTRQGLVHEARKLFSRHGYRATSLDEVCSSTGVTKGALYHHFTNKEDLFLAVLDDIEKDFIRAGAASFDASDDPWDQLRAGCSAFLDVCRRPNTRRILIEGPAIVGREGARQIDGRYLGLLRDNLVQAAGEGIIDTAQPAILAQLLFGLFSEAAMLIANAPDPEAARRDVGRELDAILAGLRKTT